MAKQAAFDFNALYALTNGAPTGLKLWIASKMLDDAYMTFHRFKNPLEERTMALVIEIEDIRTELKALAAARDQQKPGEKQAITV
jgi:hypothetical protein